MFWRHVLASTVEIEQAGNTQYQNYHLTKIFSEGFSFSGFERDKVFLNNRGQKYIEISGLSGLDSVSDGRGSAYGDFDNDGDLDVFLTTLQGQVHYLFRNNIGQESHFIRVALEGKTSGRDAYGAQVRLKTSAGVLTKLKAGGSGFISQSDPRLLFGLGSDTQAEWLEVLWPSGAQQRFGPIPAGSSVKVVEGQGQVEHLAERRFSLPEPAGSGDFFLHTLRHRPGAVFPSIALADMQGKPTEFAALRQPGKTYLVNLWATYCVPCREEMPHLQRLYPELQRSGVEIVGVSLDMGKAQAKVPDFVARMGISYPVYTTDKSTFEQLFAGEEIAIPLSFLIDPSGRISEVFSGWSPATEARLRDLIK